MSMDNKITRRDALKRMGAAVISSAVGSSMGHRTKRFFQWSGKMGERF